MLQSRAWICVALLLIFCLSAVALAAPARSEWPNDYTDFRFSSTLPGMLFGVTPTGQVGFAGALQQNVPVAYTPAWGNYVLGGNSGSFNSSPELSGQSDRKGTLFAGLGLFKAPHNLYASWMCTGLTGEGCWNAQYEVSGPPSDDSRTPAISVGCQDVLNERNRFPGDSHNARSLYAVATGPIPEATWRPIYWTVGWGNGRFRNGLAGLQVPVDDHFKVVGEWDSFNLNAGLAYGLNGAGTAKKYDVIAYAGMTALKHPVLGLTFTWGNGSPPPSD
jgi:hypothetical protein